MKSNFTPEYKAFLGCLVNSRQQANLTQAEIASRLGKPQSFVSKYERGERRLDVIEFLIIARHLNTDPYQLLREIEDKAFPSYPGSNWWKLFILKH